MEYQQTKSATFIVESVQTAKQLQSVLSRHIPTPHVICTYGRLLDFPDQSSGFSFPEMSQRVPVRDTLVDSISNLKNRFVLLALDDDYEGELIAQDAADLLGSSNSWARIRLGSMTHEGIGQAIAAGSGIDRGMHAVAVSRRVVDRAIRGFHEGPIGRVSSQSIRELTSLDRESVNALLLDCQGTGVNSFSVMSKAIAYGHSPLDTADSMQRLYEQGQISYPRTLAGISLSMNHLVERDAHGSIVPLVSSHQKTNYSKKIDEEVFRTIKSGDVAFELKGTPSKAQYAFAATYCQPFSRPSVLAKSLATTMRMQEQTGRISGHGLRALSAAQRAIPNIVDKKKNLELCEHIYLTAEAKGSDEAIKKSFLLLDDSQPSTSFKYPKMDSDLQLDNDIDFGIDV